MDALLNVFVLNKDILLWALPLLLMGLLLGPIVEFLLVGWERKRIAATGNLGSEAKHLYFQQFFPKAEKTTEKNADAKFDMHFQRRYGRRRYILPLILFFFSSLVAVCLTSTTVIGWLVANLAVSIALSPIAVAALAGAYMFALSDVVTRNRRLDFAPADISWLSFRFVIAVPFAYALKAFFSADSSFPIAIAFLIGAFPTQALMRIAQRLATRQLNFGETGEKGINELERLQGITTTSAQTFADEGITTILQLAYADAVDLTIRTGFGFSYVVDCVSQALAWIYLEDKLEKLRNYSIRGAQEIRSFMIELDGSNEMIKECRGEEVNVKLLRANAKETLEQIAANVSINPAALRRTFGEIAEDPYTCFLYEVWQ